MQQRHRLAAQAVDDVAVVHHLGAAAVAWRAVTWQGQRQAWADEAVDAVIVDAQIEPVADQARRHGVEHVAQDEAAAGGHPHAGLVVIGGAPRRQRAQCGTLQADQLLAAGVAAADQVGDPVAIGVKAVEVGAAAQQQGLASNALEMAVLALDRAVLVRDAAVVAGRLHAVMRAQRLVTAGLVVGGVLVEVAERGREAVGAMLARCAAERPQRVLQAAGQRGEALAAQHDLGVLPGGIGQHEVIETVRKRLPGDTDAEVRHIGEVRQPLLARRVVLAEDHFAFGPVFGAPGADATLQGAAQAVPVAIGMTALHLLQQRHRPHAGTTGQQRQDVALPQPAQRIGDLSPPRSLGGCSATRLMAGHPSCRAARRRRHR